MPSSSIFTNEALTVSGEGFCKRLVAAIVQEVIAVLICTAATCLPVVRLH